MKNIHVPLTADLYEQLHREAKSEKKPATQLVRMAIASWLEQRRKDALHKAIVSFAEAHAGTAVDLDSDLEAAGIEAIEDVA